MVTLLATLPVDVIERAADVRLVLTDCDGVLTDAGVYYTACGEEMKRFSMRDGMGVERLRSLGGICVAIVTKESSAVVVARAARLSVEVFTGVADKRQLAESRATLAGLPMSHVAYIGDDVNDLELLGAAGLSACPADAVPEVRAVVDVICTRNGGHGAFREFAELILEAQSAAAGAAARSRSEVP